MRDDRERLQDILGAIENIEKYISKGSDAYFTDELIQVWVVHHILIIGEAASKLSPGIREQHPATPWPDIVAMRNVLVHQYFGVDLQEVWDTVKLDLPRLKNQVETILKELEAQV
ncbi:MAG: DUF86 domain-containing protein [Deltaproteobacteria bacterium]|nr:DUF86 domain-containing protein [Deltaproteobacteria bacterium]